MIKLRRKAHAPEVRTGRPEDEKMPFGHLLIYRASSSSNPG